jgi:tRNA A-37 threonylcarbamoyl transferase component Bud32
MLIHEGNAKRLGLGRAAVESLVRALLSETGRELKADSRSTVHVHERDGRVWVVKRYTMRGPKLRLYRLLRVSGGWREWRGAARLAAASIRCTMPVALTWNGGGEALVLPYVEGQGLARWHARVAQSPQRHRTAQHIGRQIGAMAAAGITNRDHKAANLIVDAACAAGDAPPVVIDPAGLRRRRGDRQVYRMLALVYATAGRKVPVPMRAAMRCLRGVLDADTSLAAGRPRRLRYVLEAVARELRRLPRGSSV